MSALQEVIDQTAATVVDANRPWPGLFPFTEEQREYFFGRDEEIDELFHCVKRDRLALLFSKSGLGKSSLLQAGLFPLLREAAFLPVYIRLKYSGVEGSLESQVKSTLQDAIAAGDFAEVASPGADESLWEYLHRRGGNLIDHSGNVVCPVLVFDQFEEIFTLGGSNETVRRIREQFLACFADLVENSIPRQLRERLTENPKLATQFDFAAAGCRIVVSLREDYLAKLERLRDRVPSLALATNRMRLTEMTGEQALLAVSCPNPNLVSEDVSEVIVRFVAGAGGSGAEPAPKQKLKPLDELEVAPAILSLFCRELSIKRAKLNLPQITEDLVTGNAKTIIADFYHRCVDEQPREVQCLIEDCLVTELGYRNDIDLDDARKRLKRANVDDTVIDKLVASRLLHIEEHRGTLRLELTHDVLLEPVKQSRKERLEREERGRQDAALAEAKRAQAAAIVRARSLKKKARFLQKLVAAGSLLVVILSVLLLYVGILRRAAEKATQQARTNERLANDLKQQAIDNATKLNKAVAIAENATQEANVSATAEANAKDQAINKSQQLKTASNVFLESCRMTSWIFREALESQLREQSGGGPSGGSPETQAFLLKLYEDTVAPCIQGARDLYRIDPAFPGLAEYLGEAPLFAADAARRRRDTEQVRRDCTEAIEYVDLLLRRKPGDYKTHMFAAQIYSLAGTYLQLINDPEATATADTAMKQIDNVQTHWGTTHFDASDWRRLATVYYRRGWVYERSNDQLHAVDLYRRAFKAIWEAYRKEGGKDGSYLLFAMDRAKDISDNEQTAESRDQWHQVYVNIAYGFYNDDADANYRSALSNLMRDGEYPSARRLVTARIQFLKTTQKNGRLEDLEHAYGDAVNVDNKVKDWPRAVTDLQAQVNILLILKMNTIPKTAVQTRLATAYGNLAWMEILAGRFGGALEDARRGLLEDPTQTWIRVNEAHALLFAGRVTEAKNRYIDLGNVTYNQRPLVTDIKNDFQQFCDMNRTNADMIDIVRALDILDPKLNNCLASAAASK